MIVIFIDNRGNLGIFQTLFKCFAIIKVHFLAKLWKDLLIILVLLKKNRQKDLKRGPPHEIEGHFCEADTFAVLIGSVAVICYENEGFIKFCSSESK